MKVSFWAATAAPGASKNPEAYNAYLQAQYFSHARSKDALEKAAAYYEQATRLDPGYALAWTMLGSVRANQAGKADLPLEEGYRVARESVERALALDPNLGMAHAVLGWIRLTYDWDWPAADASLKRALALEPGNSRSHREQRVPGQDFGSLRRSRGTVPTGDCDRAAERRQLLQSGDHLEPRWTTG